MHNSDNRHSSPRNNDGDRSRSEEAAVEMLQFEIATWEFNQARFASHLPNDFRSLTTAARDGIIPEFMVLDAAAHPVLLLAVQHLIKKQMGPVFRGVDSDEADPSELCECAYREYAGVVPQLLRTYVEASPARRELEFGKWVIAPDMKVDEQQLLKLFDSGKICCDDLVEGLASPHGYKHVVNRSAR